MHHSFRHYKLVIDHCVTSYHSVDLRYIKRNFCCLSFDVFRRELSNGMYYDVESPSHTLTGHFSIFIPNVIRVIEKQHFLGNVAKIHFRTTLSFTERRYGAKFHFKWKSFYFWKNNIIYICRCNFNKRFIDINLDVCRSNKL